MMIGKISFLSQSTKRMLMEIFRCNESEKLLHKATKLMAKLPGFLYLVFCFQKSRYNYNSFIFLTLDRQVNFPSNLTISLLLKAFLCISNFFKLLFLPIASRIHIFMANNTEKNPFIEIVHLRKAFRFRGDEIVCNLI
jgi:hypothetical protein